MFVIEDVQMDRLRAIMNRLYDDRPLNGDQRRDLANAMFAVLQGLLPITDFTVGKLQ